MRNYTMPEKEAVERVRPKSRAARKQFLTIVGCLALGILGAVGLAYLSYRSHLYREQNWESAVATVEDVQTKLVGEYETQYHGGGMFYNVEVLAKFPMNGAIQERWIRVEQTPRTLEDARLQGRLWKGKSYFVRWKPANPGQIVIDVH